MPLSQELEGLLYPSVEPAAEGFLPVSDLHTIYWQTYGDPKNTPVVCLHGGPGSGMSSWHPRLFDLSKYYVILFDQRGCGRSTPFAELTDNTTPHLVADMEALRTHLGIDTWNVFGGSWGSTLALAYANEHPQKVRGLLLYGIFLSRPKELTALFGSEGAAAQLYPEYYTDFMSFLKRTEDRTNPISAYHRLFQSENEEVKLNAVRNWCTWELSVMNLEVEKELLQEIAEASLEELLPHAILETYYFLEDGFIDGDVLLSQIGSKITHASVHILQGRYDLVCPPVTAYELHQAIAHSTLQMLPTSGHSAKNPEMMSALLQTAQKLT